MNRRETGQLPNAGPCTKAAPAQNDGSSAGTQTDPICAGPDLSVTH